MSAQSARKVFGVGLSKTGTTSLTAALNELGIKTIHNPHDGQTLSQLRSGDLRLTIMDQYDGVTDIPVAPYYAQLDKAFPGSKFILTVRTIDSWLRSAENHWRLLPSWEADEFYNFLHAVVYGCLAFDRERFQFAFETHNRNVIQYFSGRPNDFLLMDIIGGDGWEVLCPFLGVPTPDMPFPHHNTARDTEAWATRLNRAVEEIETTVPDGQPFILVDEQEFGHLLIRGHRPIPFLERDGVWWGRPADSATGISELERLREGGATHIVFAWPAFWWLEHYRELAAHLSSAYKCSLRNERVVVFELRR